MTRQYIARSAQEPRGPGTASVSRGARPSDLRYDQTVPCGLAHRRAVGEVLVTDSAMTAPHEFLLAVQIPRSNLLWSDRRMAFHDPLAVVEAGRQGTFVIAHRYYGVPRVGMSFVSQTLDFAVNDVGLYADDGQNPLEAVLAVRLADRQQRDGVLVGMSFRAELTIAERQAMTMGGRVVFLPRADYDALRADGRARKTLGGEPGGGPRLDPAEVGRFDARNVVLGPPAAPGSPGGAGGAGGAELAFPLVVDQRHPSFYDHPQDHVPGPLIAEGFRQAAIVTARRAGLIPSPSAVPTGADAEFTDFAEPEVPAECRARIVGGGNPAGPVRPADPADPADPAGPAGPAGPVGPRGTARVHVELHQLGRRIAHAELDLAAVG